MRALGVELVSALDDATMAELPVHLGPLPGEAATPSELRLFAAGLFGWASGLAASLEPAAFGGAPAGGDRGPAPVHPRS